MLGRVRMDAVPAALRRLQRLVVLSELGAGVAHEDD